MGVFIRMGSAYTGRDNWESLYSIEGPPGKETALQYMERIFPRLPRDQRQFLQRYLTGVLLDGAVSDNGSAPRLRNWDFTMGMVVVELAEQFLDDGKIPAEFYRALSILPPHDRRTQRALGETLSKNVPLEVKKARIRDIAAAGSAERAFRAMREVYKMISIPYEGMQEDYRRKEFARLLNNANDGERDNYRPEDLEEDRD